MTDELAARVAAERMAQGLPEHVEDEAVLDGVVALLLAEPAPGVLGEGSEADGAP
jgi:hypothetical protein